MTPGSRKGRRKRIERHPVATIGSLRHSAIVRSLLAGVPVRVTAANADTSIKMIERTYSRYIGDHSDEIARRALLDPAVQPGVIASAPQPLADRVIRTGEGAKPQAA
jgi:hypothetical protein